MNIGQTLRDEGLRSALDVDRELVTYAGRKVAAIVNNDFLDFQMGDAGYDPREPVTIEVIKGTSSSRETTLIDGALIPMNLRGVTPSNLDAVSIAGVKRQVSKIQDARQAWLITTIKAN